MKKPISTMDRGELAIEVMRLRAGLRQIRSVALGELQAASTLVGKSMPGVRRLGVVLTLAQRFLGEAEDKPS